MGVLRLSCEITPGLHYTHLSLVGQLLVQLEVKLGLDRLLHLPTPGLVKSW